MLQCDRLKYWREQQNLSQLQLAKISGVSQTEISDIESFKKAPMLSTISKLAKALNICPELLISCNEVNCNYCIDKCKLKNNL